jgi:hypothetical protein
LSCLGWSCCHFQFFQRCLTCEKYFKLSVGISYSNTIVVHFSLSVHWPPVYHLFLQ